MHRVITLHQLEPPMVRRRRYPVRVGIREKENPEMTGRVETTIAILQENREGPQDRNVESGTCLGNSSSGQM